MSFDDKQIISDSKTRSGVQLNKFLEATSGDDVENFDLEGSNIILHKKNSAKADRYYVCSTTNSSISEIDTSNKNGSLTNKANNIFTKFIDSFREAESSDNQDPDDIEKIDQDDIVSADDKNMKKTIKKRHVLLISLGTGIGTGLLVGNAQALHNAGPAGLVIGFAIMGTCLYCIIQACGEMAVCYSSLPSNFNIYPTFLVEPAFGFAVAWVYCLQWLCVCPLELVTASMTIKYWTTKVNPDIFVLIFYILIIGINTFGARGYAEAEFFFNSCKVLMITGFFILGIIITCGGAGNDGYIGAKYWHNPGAFRGDRPIDQFKGIMATFVNAAFAFGASEFISITASEQENPRKAIPKAAKIMIYRILFVFLASITLIGFLVPYNSPQLMGSSGSATKASPYVIAIASHGVRVVPHFINAVILLAVLSVGNSAFYSSSRILYSLSQKGLAPKFFEYIDREGRPARAMGCSALFGIIAFCAASSKEEQVFTWLLAISGLSQLFTWIAICISHLRFRRAMKVQHRSLGEVGFKSQVGVYGSAYAAVMMTLALIAQFWVAIKPIGEDHLDAQAFFENYLAMPILIALYLGYKIWKREWRLYIPADQIDLVSHRRIFDEEVLKQEELEEKERLKMSPFWVKVKEFFF